MRQAVRLLLLMITDIALAGVCLCVFAYFHHVKPEVYSPDISKSPAAAADTVQIAVNEGGGTEPDTAPADTTPPSEPTDTPDFSTSFPDVFTDGEVIITDDSYRSGNISATVKTVSENGITYYITDIYIKNIDNLRTAFAMDSYGKGISEDIPDMAMNNNAIAAVNGDYYGTHTNRGVIIRNGVLYRANEAYGDVLVMYNDGTMAGMYEDDYNSGRDALIENAWQGWCFGPILVRDGEARLGIQSDIAGKNPRTAIGFFEPGHYCFITVDGRQDGYSSGMTYDELAECFASLGCELAYNLDGGQSSMMTFNGGVVNKPYHGGRAVSDIIYIGE